MLVKNPLIYYFILKQWSLPGDAFKRQIDSGFLTSPMSQARRKLFPGRTQTRNPLGLWLRAQDSKSGSEFLCKLLSVRKLSSLPLTLLAFQNFYWALQNFVWITRIPVTPDALRTELNKMTRLPSRPAWFQPLNQNVPPHTPSKWNIFMLTIAISKLRTRRNPNNLPIYSSMFKLVTAKSVPLLRGS